MRSSGYYRLLANPEPGKERTKRPGAASMLQGSVAGVVPQCVGLQGCTGPLVRPGRRRVAGVVPRCVGLQD